MPGPYFQGQRAAVCGCYFPDVTFTRDEPSTGKRFLHCIVHGEVCQEGGSTGSGSEPIPSEEWRSQERARLRKHGEY
jgi:hypothetical protein